MTAEHLDVPDLMTLSEAAHALHVSRKTVEREVDAGGLDGVFRIGPRGGRIIRVTRSSVEAYFSPVQAAL